MGKTQENYQSKELVQKLASFDAPNLSSLLCSTDTFAHARPDNRCPFISLHYFLVLTVLRHSQDVSIAECTR